MVVVEKEEERQHLATNRGRIRGGGGGRFITESFRGVSGGVKGCTIHNLSC